MSAHLDALADALAFAGWTCVPRYDEATPLLRVFSPSLPMIGESISVKAGVGGVPWFISSTGDPLRPCHDVPGACVEVSVRLAPLVADARSLRFRSRRWRDRIFVLTRCRDR
ncbi:hypothetical protein D0T12_10600 [Actinomadura spongiicola]|uniref:Uncharacterized protein n=1 Tax=Actinomadura spongiicola TaxID=2303421 RepID=A0A372GJE3_9ACTN|nr:hypothetical protein [Actinomadura spongiicola]RFS85477.1 hypothetical protein D0T12_10600 [Actinomadura spongiicola]